MMTTSESVFPTFAHWYGTNMGHSAFAFPEMRPTKFHVLDALGAVFERGGGSPDAVGIGGTGEAERPGKLSGIEKVRRIALIKHLVRFRDERIGDERARRRLPGDAG